MVFYAVLIVSMLTTLAMIPLLIRNADTIGAMDFPNERKVHSQVIPRVGGIGMMIGTFLPLIFLLPLNQESLGIFAGMLTIFLFGLWDDLTELSYKYKFAGQLIAAVMIVVLGGLYIKELPFLGGAEAPKWLVYPFTILCLVAVTNAMNLADGLDGLAGGTTLLSFGALAVLSIYSSDSYLLLITVAVIGSVLGFLRFNSHPASILMGDTGSQFLGLVLGVQLLLLTQEVEVLLSKTLPLLIIGLPLLDTVAVMSKRFLSGQSLFKPDKNHFHHRLLALGLTHYETVVVLYLIQSLYVGTAFLVAYSADWVPLLLFFLYASFFLLILALLEGKYTFRGQKRAYMPMFLHFKNKAKSVLGGINLQRFLPWLVFCLVMILTAYVLVLDIKKDFDVLVLVTLIGLCFIFRADLGRFQDWYDRFSTYTFSACLTYLGFQQLGISELQYVFQWVLICFSGLLVFVALSVSNSQRFETSPYDFLLILLALLVPHFTQAGSEQGYMLSLSVVKLLVLLYVFEYLISSGVYNKLAKLRFSLATCALAIATFGMI